MEKNLNMTRGNPYSLLLRFALPLMFGNIFQQLYTVVDIAIVGRGVSMDALAALGSVDWLNWMFLGIAQGFTQGFSVRMSQRFGQNDHRGLRQVIGQSVFLSAVIALAGTALAQLGLPMFFRFLQVNPQLEATAELYSRIIMAGFGISMFYNLCASILRAVGDSKTPLFAMVVASLSNIVLDLVAVFVLDWGVAGAAGATLAAQLLAGTICAVKLLRTPMLRFGREDLKPVGQLCRDLSRIGLPMAAKNVIIALGGIAVQSVVNRYDVSFIAGFTATNKLYGLLEIAAISYGYAITTYVGQNYGAQQLDRIQKGIRAAVVLSLVTAVVIAVVMLLFGRSITGIFIEHDDPTVIAQAVDTAYRYLTTMAVSLPMLYLLYVYLSALQGMGNGVMPMLSGILEFCLRVGLSSLVAYTGYRNGIFAAEVSAWYGAAIFLTISYYRQIRRIRSQLSSQTAREKAGV